MFKQVVVVRTDIKMGKGKLAAQVAHASLSSYLEAIRLNPSWAERWIEEGQKKVVLKVDRLEELLILTEKARAMGLPYCLVEDAGLTQLEKGTATALGIGPAPEEVIDSITGGLKLL